MQEICGLRPAALNGLRADVLRHLAITPYGVCAPVQDKQSQDQED